MVWKIFNKIIMLVYLLVMQFSCSIRLVYFTKKIRMTTSISSKAQKNHGWEFGQSDLKRRCLEKNGNMTEKPTEK